MNVSINKCENPRYIFTSVPVSGKPVYWRDNGRLRMSFDGRYARVPVVCECGRCDGCRVKKQREWQSRITREMVQGNDNGKLSLFVTLTLDPELCDVFGCDPADCTSKDGKRLYRELVQPFFHRLRAKRGGNLKFRYFTVSEFGSEEGRLHYHCILVIDNWKEIFNNECWTEYRNIGKYYVHDNRLGHDRVQTDVECAFSNLFNRYWSVCAKHKYPVARVEWHYNRKTDRCSKRVVWDNTVPFGLVEKVTQCDCGTAEYVTKYVNKVTSDINTHKEPFHRQSQALGLLDIVDAIEELDQKLCLAYLKEGRLQTAGKYTFAIPKYYKRKLRLFTFTYLQHNRDFVANSVGYARQLLGVGIGIPFTDKDGHRVFSVDDITYLYKFPIYDTIGNFCGMFDTSNDVHRSKFLQHQFVGQNYFYLYPLPIVKREIDGVPLLMLGRSEKPDFSKFFMNLPKKIEEPLSDNKKVCKFAENVKQLNLFAYEDSKSI